MKIVVARAQVLPEMHATFVEAAAALVAATRREPGCLAYDMYESVTAPNVFVTAERWESEAAIDAHFATAHVETFFAIAGPCLAASPLIEEFEVSARSVR